MLIHATYTEGNMIQNSSFLIANYSAHQFQVFSRGGSKGSMEPFLKELVFLSLLN